MKTIIGLFFFAYGYFLIYPESPNSNTATSEMETVAQNVLNDLKRAKGIPESEIPFVKISTLPEGQKIANILVEEGAIKLDPKTYLLAREMGSDSLDALAFILGHELGHFIHKHGETNHHVHKALQNRRIRRNTIEGITDEIRTATDALRSNMQNFTDAHEEAEADFEGAFLGYMAGYKPSSAGISLLEKVYKDSVINIDKNAPGYPSLEERVAVIRNTQVELNELVPYFEMANYLIAIQHYEEAVPYLKKIIEKFKSREIYNNIGVAQLLQMVEEVRAASSFTAYKFPISLDGNFRAPAKFNNRNTITRANGDQTDSQSEWVTEKSCEYSRLQKIILDRINTQFNQSIALDQNYAPAYLNLSIANALIYLIQEGENGGSKNCEQLQNHLLVAESNAEIARKLSTEQLNGFAALYENENGELYKFEKFGQELKTKKDQNKVQICSKTIWEINTKPNTEIVIPQAAYLLSNIYVQLDLINAFKENMDTSLLFLRALEINPQNALAQFNKRIANRTLNNSTNEEVTMCSETELFSSGEVTHSLKDIIDIVDQRNNSKISKLQSQNEFIDKCRIVQNEVTTNTFKIDSLSDFTLLRNTKTSDSNRERSTVSFLIPKTPKNHTTVCGIQMGDSIEQIKSLYGEALRTVSLVSGSLYVPQTKENHRLIYETKVTLEQFQRMETENVRPPFPEGVKGAFTIFDGRVIIEHEIATLGEDLTSDLSEPDILISEEEGIIFTLDRSNKITGWQLYEINTHKLKSEPDCPLQDHEMNQDQSRFRN